MIRSVTLKFIAFILAACMLVTAAVSMAGIALLGSQGLYDIPLAQQQQDILESKGYSLAYSCVSRYATEHFGNCTEAEMEWLLGDGYIDIGYEWSAQITLDGEVLADIGTTPPNATRIEYTLNASYPVILREGELPSEEVPQWPYDEDAITSATFWDGEQRVELTARYRTSPVYTVFVYLNDTALQGSEWELLEPLYHYRYHFIAAACTSLLLFAACFVYLCCVAGRKPGSTEVRPGGLNRMPLDLYAAIAGGLVFLVCGIGIELLEWSLTDSLKNSTVIISVTAAMALSLLVLGFLFALVAQIKARQGYWWRNSVIGRCLLLIFRCLRWIFRGAFRLLSLLPVIWQWLLITVSLGIGLLIVYPLATQTSDFFWELAFFFMPIIYIAVVCYGGYAFGTLLRGVRKMNQGDLDHKIPTKFLFGSFRDFAVALNGLSESAMVAAQKQLKSERMKTELITNVSHDIKTPLTSIINYVDLLQKPHSDEDQQQYLDVLSRQSLRLKKLIDDLMEMSKASTGNLTVDIARIDAVEAINQALGEFSGKLSAAQLTPVFTAPESPVFMQADGRLVWRVLSNLLGNAVKYALPGTRIYLDVARVDGQVLLSVKNISKEQLGIDAEELMERFVRGDASRNTEGSGLGLNIAKSLMDVQKGQLKLLVDGDLFKVTLFFPEG